jgi:hypothetical protein
MAPTCTDSPPTSVDVHPEYTGVVTQLVTHPAARSTPCGRSGPHLTSAPPRQARRELCPPEFGAHPPLDWSAIPAHPAARLYPLTQSLAACLALTRFGSRQPAGFRVARPGRNRRPWRTMAAVIPTTEAFLRDWLPELATASDLR